MMASEIILGVGRKVLMAMQVLRMSGTHCRKDDDEASSVRFGRSVEVEEISSFDGWASRSTVDVAIQVSSAFSWKDRGGIMTLFIGGTIEGEGFGFGFGFLAGGVACLNRKRFFKKTKDMLEVRLKGRAIQSRTEISCGCFAGELVVMYQQTGPKRQYTSWHSNQSACFECKQPTPHDRSRPHMQDTAQLTGPVDNNLQRMNKLRLLQVRYASPDFPFLAENVYAASSVRMSHQTAFAIRHT